MNNDEIDNQDNQQEEIGNAESNQAEISQRDGNNAISEEQQEAKNEPPTRPKRSTTPPLESNTNSIIPKRCMNDMCPAGGQVDVVRVEKGVYQYLCQHCFKQFKDNHFCFYCKQIYFGEDDGECWIECDKCNKWTHADCEQSKGDYKNIKQLMTQAAEFPFQCPNCRPKSRYEKRSSTQALAKQKLKHKRNDLVLNSYGFFWKLRPEQISADLEKMRSM